MPIWPIWPSFEVNGLDWQCSKRAPRILIFSIAMGAVYLSYLKSIATFAPTFFGYIISVLASVTYLVESCSQIESNTCSLLILKVKYSKFKIYTRETLFCKYQILRRKQVLIKQVGSKIFKKLNRTVIELHKQFYHGLFSFFNIFEPTCFIGSICVLKTRQIFSQYICLHSTLLFSIVYSIYSGMYLQNPRPKIDYCFSNCYRDSVRDTKETVQSFVIL